MDDNDAAKVVVDTANPEKAAVRLRNEAYAGGSTDNISVMVVQLPVMVTKHPNSLEESMK